jgi:hypothetical protein
VRGDTDNQAPIYALRSTTDIRIAKNESAEQSAETCAGCVQTGPDSGGAKRNESRSPLPLHGIVVFAMLTTMPIISHLLHDFIWVSPFIVCRPTE